MDVGRPHREWWEDLQEGEDVCELAPRDHGKSMALCRAYSIWRAKYHEDTQEILILGADKGFAQENLDKLKQMLQLNLRLVDLIPKDRKFFNARSEIKLSNGKTIKAKGYLSPLRGRHPQLIIMDDVCSEKNSLTEDGRKKVSDFFWQVIFPMKDKGSEAMRARGFKSQILVVGTAQHEDDLYHELLNKKVVVGRRQQAIIDAEKKEVLWPERYSFEDLMKIKAKAGLLNFSKEYQNSPITEETSLFPPSLFMPMLDRTRSYVIKYTGTNAVYMGVDFSIPGDQSGDYTVAATAEMESDGTLGLLNLWRDRPVQMADQIRKITQLTNDLNVTFGLLEDNMFQKVYTSYFKENTNLPLQGHTVGAEKNYASGLLSLRPLFENRKFRFPYQTEVDREITDTIIREFSGLMRKDGKLGNFRFHDDCVMAIWHLVVASKKQKFSYSF